MAATYEPIATTTLGSANNAITFSSIPSTYTDLRIVLVETAPSNSTYMQFNSDTATNYSKTTLTGNGGSASSSNVTSTTQIALAPGNTTIPHLITADIFSYAGSTYKTCLTTAMMDENSSGQLDINVGLWRSTSAITSIKLFVSGGTVQFAAGTTATLYGIKAA